MVAVFSDHHIEAAHLEMLPGTTMAALSGLAGVTFSDEDYNGTTITVASVDIGSLVGAATGSGALPEVGGSPVDKVELAWAVTDDVVVLGAGPEFVKHVLDTTDGTSLASNDRYESLLARVGVGTGSLVSSTSGLISPRRVEAIIRFRMKWRSPFGKSIPV